MANERFARTDRAHMQLRNNISRARRGGVVVSEVGVDRPAAAGLDDQPDVVDAEWLRAKGRHVKELAFMVGERKGPGASLRRLFVATDAEGDLLGYIRPHAVHRLAQDHELASGAGWPPPWFGSWPTTAARSIRLPTRWPTIRSGRRT